MYVPWMVLSHCNECRTYHPQIIFAFLGQAQLGWGWPSSAAAVVVVAAAAVVVAAVVVVAVVVAAAAVVVVV